MCTTTSESYCGTDMFLKRFSDAEVRSQVLTNIKVNSSQFPSALFSLGINISS